jgi:hypothetical protein
MSAPSTTPRPKAPPTGPTFWKRYSPHGECPLSFTGSVLLHLIPVGLLIALGAWIWPRTDENAKPPIVTVLEVEGGGGGLGGLGVGPGKLDSGDPGRHEGGAGNKGQQFKAVKVGDFKFKELDKILLVPPDFEKSAEAESGDFPAYFQREQEFGQKALDSQLKNANGGDGPKGFAGGDKYGPEGGAGGSKGPGKGNKQGPGQGDKPYGGVLTEQRRRELRWTILASADGPTHLKKLQALKVTLFVPVPSEPGYAYRYDLSKPTLRFEKVKFVDDAKKVRWVNKNDHEMGPLAKALKLSFVPPFTVIYLSSELEAAMARRELERGVPEHMIERTYWDIEERDGGYDDIPYIKEQVLRKAK